MYDVLIVGAGLYGATCARLLADAGKKVLAIDRRDHIAGNCYDEIINTIFVNRYGGHIFHTNSESVWNFLSRFTEWKFYEHRVKACYLDRIYSFPPNKMTLDQLGMQPGPEAEQKIREMFFVGYTEKQWGKPYEQVPASVTARIPIRYTYDDRYFSDRYQGLPIGGYTRMVDKMLEGIDLELHTDFCEDSEYWRGKANRVIYSGPLDELFGYELGKLEYRSLRFDTRTEPIDDYQSCPTMNYCDGEIPWTRVMEWKHFGWQKTPKGETVITIEYPEVEGDPYYPVGDDENLALYRKYADLAVQLKWLRFGGRLANYRYWNMDQVVARAMNDVKEGIYV